VWWVRSMVLARARCQGPYLGRPAVGGASGNAGLLPAAGSV